MRIAYAVQAKPEGLAQAFLLAEEFLAGAPSALILGDNIFYGNGLPELLQRASEDMHCSTVFAYKVADPSAYGVVDFDSSGRAVSIEEKPAHPTSNWAVTGLYFCNADAPRHAATVRPSPRGELEITDLLRCYLESDQLDVQLMGRGMAWLDTGTHASLLDAAQYVRITEERQGLKICCPEEIAWRQGFIGDAELEALAAPLRKSGYGEYLLRQLAEAEAAPARVERRRVERRRARG